MKFFLHGRAYFPGIVLTALLVGFLYAAPQFLIKRAVVRAGGEFTLSQFTHLSDGGDMYFQFAREVVDGHFPPTDLFFDGKSPGFFPPLPPLFLAAFIYLFRDVNLAYIVANFFISGILFIGFYLLGRVIFDGNRLWSFFSGLLAVLTPIALHLPYAFFSLENILNVILKNFYPGVKTLLPTLFLARVDYPLLTHLVYIPAIAAFLVFWQRPKKTVAILAGLCAGLLFYTYFYKSAYWLAVIGVAFLYAIIFRRRDTERLKNFFLLIGVTILISIPYFINFFNLNSLPSMADYAGRIEVEQGRVFLWWPWPHYLAYAILAGLVYLIFWRRSVAKEKAILFWIFLGAAFLVWNVQLVTGFVPHPDHWPRAISLPVFVIILSSLYELAKKIELRQSRIKALLAPVLILLLVLLVAKKAVNSYAFSSPPQAVLNNYTFPKDLVESWRWIDRSLTEPKVISPSFVNSMYLSAFTSARPFLPWGGATPVSNFELEELFLKTNKTFGVSNDVLEKRLRDGQGMACLAYCDRPFGRVNLNKSSFFIYGLYFKDETRGLNQNIPESKMQELLNRYDLLAVDWQETGADYAYLGPLEKQFTEIELSKEKGLQLVYKNNSVEIYKIK